MNQLSRHLPSFFLLFSFTCGFAEERNFGSSKGDPAKTELPARVENQLQKMISQSLVGDEKLLPNAVNAGLNQKFGYAVAMDQDLLVVGVPFLSFNYALNGGGVYVFERNAGGPENWGQIARLIPNVNANRFISVDNLNFGTSVAIFGDTVAVGAPNFTESTENPGAGAVFMFERNSGGADTWGQVAQIEPIGGSGIDQFGLSVSLQNDTLAVGAPDQFTGPGAGLVAYWAFEGTLQDFAGSADGTAVGSIAYSSGMEGFALDLRGVDAYVELPSSILDETDSCSIAFHVSRDSFSVDGINTIFSNNVSTSNAMKAALIELSNQGEFQLDGASTSATAALPVDNTWVHLTFTYDRASRVFSAFVDGALQSSVLNTDLFTACGAGTGSTIGADQNSEYHDGQIDELRIYNRALNAEEVPGVITGEQTITRGAVYLYERDSGGVDSWGEIARIPGVNSFNGFGEKVDLSGDNLAIFSDRGTGLTSSVFMHARNTGGSNNWGQVTQLVPPAGGSISLTFRDYEQPMSLDGDTLVVSGSTANQEEAWRFDGANSWLFSQTLANCSIHSQNQRLFVHASASVIALGTDRFGSPACIYEQNFGGINNWGLATEVANPAGSFSTNLFGATLAISANSLALGAQQADLAAGNFDAGTVYVHAQDTGGVSNWGQEKEVIPEDYVASTRMGTNLDRDGNYLIVGAINDANQQGINAGAGYIYELTGGSWQFASQLIGNNAGEAGRNVAISGTTAVISDVGNSNTDGTAHLFERQLGSWVKVTELRPPNPSALYGFAVDVQGDTAVVPDFFNLHIFYRNEGGPDNWGHIMSTPANDPFVFDLFGVSIDVSEDESLVAVGAIQASDNGKTNAGAVYLFERDLGGTDNWGRRVKLFPGQLQPGDTLGREVTITNNRLFAAAPSAGTLTNSATGKIFVFDRDFGGADSWGLVDILTPSVSLDTLSMGFSIDVVGDRMVAGAPSIADSVLEQEGLAFVFEHDPTSNQWEETGVISASDGVIGNAFGRGIDLSGTTLTVTASLDSELAFEAGAAYIFRLPDLQLTDVTGPAISVADPLTAVVEVGSSVTYSIDVENPGDGDAEAVLVTVEAPRDCATLNASLSPGWAVINPGSANPTFSFNLGDLESQSNDQLTLTLDISPSQPIAGACEVFSLTFAIDNSATTGARDYFSRNNQLIFLMDIVEVSNQPPLLSGSLPDQSRSAGAIASIDLSDFFSDPDMDPITFSATGLPETLSLNTSSGLITGVTTLSDFNASPFDVDISATDVTGSGITVTDSFVLTLTNAQPTLVSAPPPFNTVIGEDLLIDLAPFFDDADEQILNFSLSGSSAYTVGNFGQAGLLRGIATTTELQQSPLSLTLQVFDGFGGQLNQTITINVFDQLSPQFSFERYFPALQQPWYFSDIADIETAADDSVYLADAERGKVLRFSKDGLLITQWGQLGSGPGEFSFLQLKLAVATDGRVFTASNTKLQTFNRNGELLSAVDMQEPLVDVAVDKNGQVYLLFSDRFEIRAADQFALIVESISLNRPATSLVVSESGVVFVAQRSSSSPANNDEIIRFFPPLYTATAGIPTQDADDLSIGPLGEVYAVGDFDGVIRAYDINGTQTVVNNISAVGGNSLKALGFDTQGRNYVSNGSAVFGVEAATDMRAFAWQSGSSEAGRFDQPLDISADSAQNLYVLETTNSRVQKFSRDGTYLTGWPLPQLINSPANARAYVHASRFSPVRILVATSADIALYDSDGNPVTPNPFDIQSINQPGPIDETVTGQVVLSDLTGSSTQVYVVAQSGIIEQGPWTAPTCAASDMAVGNNNLVYLLCEPGSSAVEIQAYTLAGQRVTAATIDLSAIGNPRSLDVDSQGRIYISATQTSISPQGITAVDSLISVYRSDGTPLGQFGAAGYSAGRFDFAGELAGIHVGQNGEIFQVEPGNNRVQIFNPINLARNTKAIVVAGGGDYPENYLWEATQINTNNAYDKLSYQGFTPDRIAYLHPDLSLDLDGNPATIEVTGAPTRENLRDAIINWAADADNLVIYLADHGDKEIFRVNPEEVLDSGTLSGWLSDLQDNAWPGRGQPPVGTDGWITIIYEACESGTFQDNLAPLNSEATNKRVVITTSSSDQNASFIAQGLLSFSYQFWINVFNGANVLDAYTLASATIADSYPQQAPILSLVSGGTLVSNIDSFFTSSNFSARNIGNGTTNPFAGPEIIGTQTTLIAGASGQIDVQSVADSDGIARVWAIIEPPEYMVRDSENPVLELPTFDLGMNCAAGIDYCGSFNGFTSTGDYRIEILAQDIFGNVSRYPNRQQPVPDPDLTLTVGNPLRNKVALFVAGDSSARGLARLGNGDFAYQALIRQNFLNDLEPSTPNVLGPQDEVRYFTQGQFTGADVGSPSTGQLNNLLTSGFVDSTTQNLTLVLMADYGGPEIDGFLVPGQPPLLTSEINEFLDAVEPVVQGKIAVILEGSGGGTAVPVLSANSDRRIIVAAASAGERAGLLGAGGISFSRFFWNAVRDGFSLGTAFQLAADAIKAGIGNQNPVLDDNGNGIGNDPTDRIAARRFFLGPGIARAGNGPLIGRLMPDLEIANENVLQALIVAENVTSTSDRPVGVVGNVRVPGTNLTVGSFPLMPVNDVNKGSQVINLGDYSGSFDGFVAAGDYAISVFAVDDKGNPSSPKRTTLRKTAGPDIFEVDDVPANSTPVAPDAAPQRHTLHRESDEDWLLFALGDPTARVLNIRLTQLDPGLQLNLQVFDASRLVDEQSPALVEQSVSFSTLGIDVAIPATLPQGIYLVRVSRTAFTPTGESDPSPGYSIGLNSPFGDLGGLLTGTVTDAISAQPIGLARVTAVSSNSGFCGTATCDAAAVPTCDRAICGELGGFRMFLNQGEYALRVEAPGYTSKIVSSLAVQPGGTTGVMPDPITLQPLPSATAPTLTVDSAFAVGEKQAQISGSIDANGSQTTGRFLIGEAGQVLEPVSPSFFAAGNATSPVSALATGLDCGTTYDVSASAENAGGQSAAGTLSITTAQCGSTEVDVVFSNGFE